MTVAFMRVLKINDFKRIDYYQEETVRGLAFKQGGLYYFRKNSFSYLTVSEDHLLATKDGDEVTIYAKRKYDLQQCKWA